VFFGGLGEGLVFAGAPGGYQYVLVENDDGARDDAGGEVVEDGLCRRVQVAVDVHEARGSLGLVVAEEGGEGVFEEPDVKADVWREAARGERALRGVGADRVVVPLFREPCFLHMSMVPSTFPFLLEEKTTRFSVHIAKMTRNGIENWY
jgi:hypothetical protein